MVEKGIRGGICHAIHRYAKANNKYMKDCKINIISSYLEYLDANNLYGWGMSQRLPVNGLKWVKKLLKVNENFIKNYNEKVIKDIFLKQTQNIQKNFFNLHKDLPFLAERKKTEKCKKLACSIHSKENYVVHIRALKQVLNHGLMLKKLYRVIQFNQEARLKLI